MNHCNSEDVMNRPIITSVMSHGPVTHSQLAMSFQLVWFGCSHLD